MAARRGWSSLSPSYRARLERRGINRMLYESGFSIRAARGHAETPERPSQAFRNPDTYGRYLRRRRERGGFVPQGTLPPVGEPERRIIGDRIGWPSRYTHSVMVFSRSRGGSVEHEPGSMTKIIYHPDGTVNEIDAGTYDQADFITLTREAKARGWTVQVVSVPAMGVSA